MKYKFAKLLACVLSAGCTLVPQAAVAQYPSTAPDAICQWSFEETFSPYRDTASTVADNAVWTGSPLSVPGRIDKAARFSTGKYAVVSPSTELNESLDGRFTVTFWINPSALGGGMILEKRNASDVGFLIERYGSGILVQTNDGTYANVISGADHSLLETAKWTHVAVTVDRLSTQREMRIYFNGKLETSTNWVRPGSFLNTVPLYIGSNKAGGSSVNADLDDLRIHNRVLTEAEIDAVRYDRKAGDYYVSKFCQSPTGNQATNVTLTNPSFELPQFGHSSENNYNGTATGWLENPRAAAPQGSQVYWTASFPASVGQFLALTSADVVEQDTCLPWQPHTYYSLTVSLGRGSPNSNSFVFSHPDADALIGLDSSTQPDRALYLHKPAQVLRVSPAKVNSLFVPGVFRDVTLNFYTGSTPPPGNVRIQLQGGGAGSRVYMDNVRLAFKRVPQRLGCPVFSPKPVVHWRFMESGAAGSTLDEAGDVMDLLSPITTAPPPVLVSGVSSRARKFSSGSGMTAVHSTDLFFTNKFTIAAWAKFDANGSGNQIILDKRASTAGIAFYRNQNGLGLRIGGNTGLNARTYTSFGLAIAPNQWTYIAVSLNGSLLTFFADGQSETQPIIAGPFGSTVPLLVGKSYFSSNTALEGTLDEITIWKQALTQAELCQTWAMQGKSCRCRQPLPWVVAVPALTSIPTAPVPTVIGNPLSLQFQVADANDEVTYQLDGLQPGMVFDADSGTLSGTCLFPGTYPLRLRAENALGRDEKILTIQATASTSPIFLANPAQITAPTGYAFEFAPLTGGAQNVTYTATGLPPGLSIDTATGTIHGTMLGTNLTYPVNITASNPLGSTSTSVTLVTEVGNGTGESDPPGSSDSDGDGIADSWEILHFGSLTACSPTGDPDGDGFDNLTEFFKSTDPKVPDADQDGIDDLWEIRYFGSIAACNPTGDPDTDGRNNASEFAQHTNPKAADLNFTANLHENLEDISYNLTDATLGGGIYELRSLEQLQAEASLVTSGRGGPDSPRKILLDTKPGKWIVRLSNTDLSGFWNSQIYLPESRGSYLPLDITPESVFAEMVEKALQEVRERLQEGKEEVKDAVEKVKKDVNRGFQKVRRWFRK